MQQRDRDTLRRFLFENLAIRGELVRLDTAWQTILERRAYPAPVSQILGEAMAAAALLSASIKLKGGLLTLQLQTKGPLPLLVVHCSSAGLLRGMARWRKAAETASFSELCNGGTLVITLDPGHDGERYQGIVDLTGASLTEAIELYFERSEQLPTRLHLVADGHSAAGLLLQRLPLESSDSDAWNRIQQLGATLTDNELLQLDACTIIHRLFHEENVRLYEPMPLAFRCTCSKQRTGDMLISLGRSEVQDILSEQGKVEVSCQFCGMRYHFDAVDAGQLFAASVQPNIPSTRH
jgi:molecular chaperone Hsp33